MPSLLATATAKGRA